MSARSIWLNINEAAQLSGRSVSTLRRLLPDIEASSPEDIRREPLEGKGGERILLSRAYILERFNVKEEEEEPNEEPPALDSIGAAQFIEILERDLSAKTRQIEALLRDGESKSRQLEEAQLRAGELVERLAQFAAINAGLQNKLLSLTEKAGEQEPVKDSAGGVAWYYVVVSVILSLCGGLLLWLCLGPS